MNPTVLSRSIFIPGNHDGDPRVRRGDEPDTEPSLFGFTENFCAPQPHQISAYRATMTQPYVYWTLDAPLVTIIGLYSNVEGTLDARGTFEQQRWLEQQLAGADKNKFLVVAVHHPPYSLDKTHGGYPTSWWRSTRQCRRPRSFRTPCCRDMFTICSASRGVTRDGKSPT